MINANKIQEDFPILQQKAYGKRLVYLDSAATAQKPQAVLQAMDEFYRTSYANVHRGIYRLGEEATLQYEAVREKGAAFINAKREEIIFTKSATEACNLLAYSLGEKLQEGDEILLTEMEHHSNLVPWQQLAKKKKLVVKFIPITAEGALDMKAAKKLITPKTKIASIVHVSNVLGTINPAKELMALAHKHGALGIIDAAQSVPHLPVDVEELNCDFLFFSGHKLLGPSGIGVLYGKKERLESLEPFLFGGDMIKEVSFAGASWNEVPWKFEAGTPNITGVIGLGAAIDYLSALGMEAVAQQGKELVTYTRQELAKIPGITLYGPAEGTAVVSFSIAGVPPHDVAALLDREGLAVRAGNHCAMPLLSKLGVPGTVRASFSVYNTQEDVDALVAGIKKVQEVFRQ